METLNPSLVRDIREDFCEEETFKMRLETTGQRSGDKVIQAEETMFKGSGAETFILKLSEM